MKLYLSENEIKIVNELASTWVQEHRKTCVEQNLPHRGGILESRISYTFTPTSIGNFCTVKCWCGELVEIDLT